MDKKRFLEESHEYIESLYADFCGCQDVVDDVFKVFHSICVKNEIRYFLAYGTLLGKVRDGHNVPWDYDYDVAIPITDAEKLITALKADLPEGYIFESNFCGKDSPFFQTRITKKGYEIDLIHLDIFYVAGAPDNGDVEKFRNKVIRLFNARWEYYAVDYYGKQTMGALKRFTKKALIKFKYKDICFARLDKTFKKLSEAYDFNTAKNLIFFNYLGGVLPSKTLFPVKTVKSADGEYNLPADENAVLTSHYGDYKKYPPIGSRFNEFYSLIYTIKQKENK